MINAFVTQLFLALCFGILLMEEARAKEQKSRSLIDIMTGQGQPSFLYRKLLIGIIVSLFGYLFYTGEKEMLEPWRNNGWSFLIPFLIISTLIFGYFTAGKIITKQSNVFTFPSFRSTYILIRIVHLILYEFFFRAVLLSACIKWMGVIPAVLTNLLLYSVIHWHSSRNEIIGTIPFGLLLCILTISFNSIWPAIIMHLALAMGHELRLLYQHSSSTKFWKL